MSTSDIFAMIGLCCGIASLIISWTALTFVLKNGDSVDQQLSSIRRIFVRRVKKDE